MSDQDHNRIGTTSIAWRGSAGDFVTDVIADLGDAAARVIAHALIDRLARTKAPRASEPSQDPAARARREAAVLACCGGNREVFLAMTSYAEWVDTGSWPGWMAPNVHELRIELVADTMARREAEAAESAATRERTTLSLRLLDEARKHAGDAIMHGLFTEASGRSSMTALVLDDMAKEVHVTGVGGQHAATALAAARVELLRCLEAPNRTAMVLVRSEHVRRLIDGYYAVEGERAALQREFDAPDGPMARAIARSAYHAEQQKRRKAEGEVANLRAALDRDRTGLVAALADIVGIVAGRAWVAESRGCYTWDDDRYKEEAGEALREVRARAEDALRASGVLAQRALFPERAMGSAAATGEINDKERDHG